MGKCSECNFEECTFSSSAEPSGWGPMMNAAVKEMFGANAKSAVTNNRLCGPDIGEITFTENKTTAMRTEYQKFCDRVDELQDQMWCMGFDPGITIRVPESDLEKICNMAGGQWDGSGLQIVRIVCKRGDVDVVGSSDIGAIGGARSGAKNPWGDEEDTQPGAKKPCWDCYKGFCRAHKHS